MPSTIHCTGYLSKEEAARKQNVQVRTINIQIRKKVISAVTIDGLTFVKDNSSPALPAGISLDTLEWVYRAGRRNGISSDLLYEQIILGNISAVIIANRVFIINNEPALLSFLASKRIK